MSLLCNINGNNKITTTFPLSKLEEVPAWSAPAVARAPHSAGVSSASSASNRTVDRAEPCFITKASAYTHKQVHWVNTIRGKDPENGEWGVESFLFMQGIVGRGFKLDHACNSANIDASLHVAMDKYAMICITCSEKFLDKYIKIITAENEAWESHLANHGEDYLRNLKIFDRSVRFAEYELVVLQPDHFLPDDSLLPLYVRQHRLGQFRVEKVKYYKMAADRMLREQTGQDSGQSQTRRFHPFRFIAERELMVKTINPYLVILAADIKFRRYLAANGPRLPPVYNSLMRKTIKVADLLYFRPEYNPGSLEDMGNEKCYEWIDISEDDEMDPLTVTNNPRINDSTVRQTDIGGTRDMDSNYWRHMLSGRDLELNDDDLDLLREIQESNKAASSHGQSLENVDVWRRETAGKLEGSEA